jgi:predicted amidohydrolase
VRPGEQPVFYDKHHLFTYGGEHHRYTAGQERVVVEWRGVRFLLRVCYDLRFPIWARNCEDYDAAIYVASWPTPRVEAWRTLLKARAIENQCYILGVNRGGNDPACQYCGGTAFIDPYGQATECPDNEATHITAEIDMDRLHNFRLKFLVLKDRDR